jgi:hypothetical protein
MALPVAQIDIQKFYIGEYWTNRYLTDLPVGDAATETLALAIANAEKPLYFNVVRIQKIRIASLQPNDNVYQTWDPNLVGTRAGTATAMLPLFNVVRVDFGAGLGRPSRKYLRGVLSEIDSTGPNIEAGTITTFLNPYGNTISGLAGIVDPQGDDLNGFSVTAAIGMRQLRRGTRRRTESVL